MLPRRLSALVLAALALLAVGAAGVLAATPKDGTYAGKTDSGQKITIKVKNDGKKATVQYCDYSMTSKVRSGKFEAKYSGPGGVYLAVEGSFPTKKSAKGTITVDFLCDTEGEGFKANLK